MGGRQAGARGIGGRAAAGCPPSRPATDPPAGAAAAGAGGRAADHGGVQESSAARSAGKVRPASRTSTGTSSPACRRSVMISLGSQGSSTESGSRANALDMNSTTSTMPVRMPASASGPPANAAAASSSRPRSAAKGPEPGSAPMASPRPSLMPLMPPLTTGRSTRQGRLVPQQPLHKRHARGEPARQVGVGEHLAQPHALDQIALQVGEHPAEPRRARRGRARCRAARRARAPRRASAIRRPAATVSGRPR